MVGVVDVTESELAACTATLSKLSPSDLELAELAELYAAGKALFSSRVIKERFQSEDVVAFFKQQGEGCAKAVRTCSSTLRAALLQACGGCYLGAPTVSTEQYKRAFWRPVQAVQKCP